MTFGDMLRLLEDFGPLTAGEPGDWAQDRKNGVEFLRKGIRDTHSVQDGDVVPEKKLRKSAKGLYCGKSLRPAK